MAESVKVIDPDSGSGYDYDILFDWDAAQQADIDTSNTIAVAKCRCTGGTADTTAVTIAGWTTSATDYIKIWTDPSESYRHNGTFPSSGNTYRMNNAAIVIEEENITVDGIAVGSNDYTGIGCHTGIGYFIINVFNCVVKENSPGQYHRGIIFYNTDGTNTGYAINNIVYGYNYTDSYGIAANNCTVYAYNNTISDCTNGLRSYGSNVTINAKNNLFSGCDYDATGTMTLNDTYCATSNDNTKGLTALGTGNRFSQTFTFAGASDFHLASNDAGALGYGLNLYNDAVYPFQDDIDGQDRGGAAAAWDIGADEYVSTTSIEFEGFRFRNDDGSETTATWKADQDVNITAAANTAMRLRTILNATGDPDSIGSQLEYRYKPSGGAFGSWIKVT